MARNIAEIYLDNPLTTLGNNDLIYAGEHPYDTGDDAAIKYSDLLTQLKTQMLPLSGGTMSGSIVITSPAYLTVQNVNMASWVTTAGDGSNFLFLQPGQSNAFIITDGHAPAGYLNIDSVNQNINLTTPLNIKGETTSINFVGKTIATGTISATGTTVTFSSSIATAAFKGGYVTPGSGASFTPFYIVDYTNATTIQSSLSQTIAPGSNYSLTYQTLNNGGGFNNGAMTQSSPYYQNFFGGYNSVTFGTTDNPNLMFNCWGTALFPNAIAVGSNSTNRFNSSNITAHQSSYTLTATAAIFQVNADEGKMILFADGESGIILHVNSTTQAMMTSPKTIAEQQFQILGGFNTNNIGCYMDGFTGQIGCFNLVAYNGVQTNFLQAAGNTGGNIAVNSTLDFQSVPLFNVTPLFNDGIDMQDTRIVNLSDPSDPQDATTKIYTDSNFLLLAGGTLTGALTLNGDPSTHVGINWNGATGNNIMQVPSNLTEAVKFLDVAGNDYYAINSSTARPKNSYNIEIQSNQPFFEQNNVFACGIPYNTTGALSASSSGTTVTGISTSFPAGCKNGIIYWPSTQQYALITARNSTTSLTIDTSITQASAPFVIYYNGITHNSQSNTFALSPATSIQINSLISAPTDSHTATTAFGNSLTLGTPKQNTTGYDIMVNIVISVTAATTATIVMGVGSTSTPTTDTAVSTFSLTGDFTLTAYVPNNYYLLVDKTGTLTSTNNVIAMAI